MHCALCNIKIGYLPAHLLYSNRQCPVQSQKNAHNLGQFRKIDYLCAVTSSEVADLSTKRCFVRRLINHHLIIANGRTTQRPLTSQSRREPLCDRCRDRPRCGLVLVYNRLQVCGEPISHCSKNCPHPLFQLTGVPATTTEKTGPPLWPTTASSPIKVVLTHAACVKNQDANILISWCDIFIWRVFVGLATKN